MENKENETNLGVNKQASDILLDGPNHITLIDPNYRQSTFVVKENSALAQSLKIRKNVKVDDSTLPSVDYVLLPSKHSVSVNGYDLEAISLYRKEPAAFVQRHLIDATLNEKSLDKKNKFLITNDTSPNKKPRSLIMTTIVSLLFLTIGAMFVYSIIDAFIVYSQWILYINNTSAFNAQATLGGMYWVKFLKPAYLYQYFFSSSGQNILGPGLGSAYRIAHTAANYSLGGFGLVSVERFMNVNNLLTGGLHMSSAEQQLYYPFIIQIIYSLIGLWICVALILAPKDMKSKTAWIIVAIACCFVII